MTIKERLRQLVSALPSDDSAVTITRADLITLLEDDTGETGVDSTRDLTVKEVAKETGRAPSTVRDWLISGALRGYKLNNRDWRVPLLRFDQFRGVWGPGWGPDVPNSPALERLLQQAYLNSLSGSGCTAIIAGGRALPGSDLAAQRSEKRQQFAPLTRVEVQRTNIGVLIGIRVSPVIVELENLFQRGDAPIVHVRRGTGDIAQRRSLERTACNWQLPGRGSARTGSPPTYWTPGE